MSLRGLACIVVLLFASATVCAQRPLGIAYYDLDRLYDTIPSLFYNDAAYTPQSRLRWNTERYQTRIGNTAAVIDSMALPLVGLCGVENEQVVRDISGACRGDYTYMHRTLNSLDGMDFALLYYGDLFYPDYDEPGRDYLYIEGELRRPISRNASNHPTPQAPTADTPPTRQPERLGLLLCCNTRMAEQVIADLRNERPSVRLVILGRTSSVAPEKYGLNNATARAARAGRGNVRSSSGWRMRDRILTDTRLEAVGGDVFARSYLVDQKSGYPLQTYRKGIYTPGYSYALPIFVYIR